MMQNRFIDTKLLKINTMKAIETLTEIAIQTIDTQTDIQ